MPIDRRRVLLSGGAIAISTLANSTDSSAPVLARMCTGTPQAAGMRSLPSEGAPRAPSPVELLRPRDLARFVDRLPLPPIARRADLRPDPLEPGRLIPWYRLSMRETEQRFHRDLPPTRLWSYDGRVPGPTIEARSGNAVLIEWRNDLPACHFLPIDHSLHGAERSLPDVRTVAHLHGGRVPPQSDGYPEDWFTRGRSALYRYPNQQEAALLWYHDHAMGIERLNQYAGLFGLFVIRDEIEEALSLPNGTHELPLVICDRMLTQDGQLYYPIASDPERPWVPEVYGDAILVNGKLFPYAEVEPRAYRLRVLNASNARFLDLAFSDRRPFHVIGTDQGLLAESVEVSFLSLAPAERTDLLVDFSALAGREVRLLSQTFELLQFRVRSGKPPSLKPLPRTLRPVPRIRETSAVRTRTLALEQYSEPGTERMLMLLNGARWSAPVTEQPLLGSTEVWSFVNVTEDIHPIHLHLVRFQILDRRAFDIGEFQNTRTLRCFGPTLAPSLEERGWKDTVQAHPGMVTRIAIRFEGFAGRYVWHCHILEHAANQMMRPFEVLAV